MSVCPSDFASIDGVVYDVVPTKDCHYIVTYPFLEKRNNKYIRYFYQFESIKNWLIINLSKTMSTSVANVERKQTIRLGNV